MLAPKNTDVTLYSAAGVELNGNRNALLTVASSTTYYAELTGAGNVGLSAMQWCWAATIAAAITYESTNLPMADATTFVAAGALWFPETGVTTLTIAGGSAGTNMAHFVNYGARRMRAKIVVTTGGAEQIRGRAHFKAAA